MRSISLEIVPTAILSLTAGIGGSWLETDERVVKAFRHNPELT
jgi:hypothetical protein